MIRRHFPADRDAAILELGCGRGALLHAFRQTGHINARGVDGSSEQVDAARCLASARVARWIRYGKRPVARRTWWWPLT